VDSTQVDTDLLLSNNKNPSKVFKFTEGCVGTELAWEVIYDPQGYDLLHYVQEVLHISTQEFFGQATCEHLLFLARFNSSLPLIVDVDFLAMSTF